MPYQSPKLELTLEGRSLGKFSRGALLSLHAELDVLLLKGSKAAAAFVALTPKQKEDFRIVIDVICGWLLYDDQEMEGLNPHARKICSAMLLDVVPGATPETIAGALRIRPERVEQNRAWLKAREASDENAAVWGKSLRAQSREALKAKPRS